MAKAFVKDLATYIRAGYPIVTIVSSEEDRALELVDELLRQKEMWKRPRKLFVWSVSRGFVDPEGRPATKEDTRRPERARRRHRQTPRDAARSSDRVAFTCCPRACPRS